MNKFASKIVKNVAMIAVGGALAVLAKKSVDTFTYPDSENYICGPAEINTEIKHIDIKWLFGEVRVKTWDYKTVAFVEEASQEIEDKDSLYYQVVGNKLFIRFCKSGNVINFKKKVLTVCIPNGLALDDIRIEGANSNVDIFDVIVDKVEIETTNGNVLADIPSSDEVYATTTSGNVEINVSSLGIMNVKTNSGNIGAYSDVVPSYLDLNSNSGEVTIKMPAYAKFNPNVETKSGKIYSEYRYQESDEKINVKTNTGNIYFIMK